MGKDIFNGKIKKEYFSYILGCMIFFALLFVAGGSLCIYAFVSEGSFNVSGERLLLAIFGIISFVLGGGYVFSQFFVIRNFPKYPKLRRILFNSDIYFTDSTSNEYFGGSRTLRGRRYKAVFDLITSVAETEKRMGEKKPIRYTVYGVLAILFGVLGLVDLIAMPLLFDNGTIFPNMSDDVFLFCYLSGAFICMAFVIFFLFSAIKVEVVAPFEKNKWIFELNKLLVDISVRKNNKKCKYWYDRDQIEQIENLVRSTSEYAELKLQTKGKKIVSFKVIDTLNNSVTFIGWFK